MLVRKEVREMRNELLLLLGLLFGSYLISLFSTEYTPLIAFLMHVCFVFPLSALLFGVFSWGHERERDTLAFLESLPVRTGYIHRVKLLVYGLVLLGLGLPCFAPIAVVFSHEPLFILPISVLIIFPVAIICGRWLNSVLSGILFGSISLMMYLGLLWSLLFVTDHYLVFSLHSAPSIELMFKDILLFIILLAILIPGPVLFHLKLKNVLITFLIIIPVLFFSGVRVCQFSLLWGIDSDFSLYRFWRKAMVAARDVTRSGFHAPDGTLYLAIASGLVEIDPEGLDATHYNISKIPEINDEAVFSSDGSKLAFNSLTPFQNKFMTWATICGIPIFPDEYGMDNYVYIWDLDGKKLVPVEYIDTYPTIMIWNESGTQLAFLSYSDDTPWTSWKQSNARVMKQIDLERGTITELFDCPEGIYRFAGDHQDEHYAYFYTYEDYFNHYYHKIRLWRMQRETGRVETIYERNRESDHKRGYHFDNMRPSLLACSDRNIIVYDDSLLTESGSVVSQLETGEHYLGALGGCNPDADRTATRDNHWPVLFLIGYEGDRESIGLRLHHEFDRPAHWQLRADVVYASMSPDRQYLVWCEPSTCCAEQNGRYDYHSWNSTEDTFYKYSRDPVDVHIMNTLTCEETMIEGVSFERFGDFQGITIRWSPSGQKCALLPDPLPYWGNQAMLYVFEAGECVSGPIDLVGWPGAFDWLDDRTLVYLTWDGQEPVAARFEPDSGETDFFIVNQQRLLFTRSHKATE